MNYRRKRFCVSSSVRGTLLCVPTASRGRPTTAAERRVLGILNRQRLDNGLSQTQLAEAVGVSQSQLSKLLSGDRAVTMTELTRMCKALDLRLSDVLARAGL